VDDEAADLVLPTPAKGVPVAVFVPTSLATSSEVSVGTAAFVESESELVLEEGVSDTEPAVESVADPVPDGVAVGVVGLGDGWGWSGVASAGLGVVAARLGAAVGVVAFGVVLVDDWSRHLRPRQLSSSSSGS
jgi:hypothetical protein